MGNCGCKSDKVKKDYIRKKSKQGTDVSAHAEINDFDQAPQRNKQIYNAVGDDMITQKIEYTLSNQDFINYISPFDDSSKFMLAVNKDINIIEVEKGSVIETLTHPKQVTQCFSFNDDKNIVSLCRDTIVRIFDINDEEDRNDTVELKGHSLSATTGCISLGETILATGGRDYTTILWDIESQKETHKNRIDRNMVTDMKWMPNDNNTFVQCSEDLRMRFFDIREGLEIGNETTVGTNFATSCDIDDSGNYITTGHRGFNDSGCSVKLWDIRKITNLDSTPVFEVNHKFSVVSAKFFYAPTRTKDKTFIISASADKSMKVINMQGQEKSWTDSKDSYSAMSPLRKSYNSERENVETDNIVVAGTIKPELHFYTVKEDTLSIIPYAKTK